VVKVLDFGLAKTAGDGSTPDLTHSPKKTVNHTADGAVMGTPGYMSPEQARGQVVDKRTDMWAFGCVLYEMLTRQRAFGGDSPTDVLTAVVATEPDWTRLPAETPAAIRTLLRRCLEKNRARRLDSATAARLEIDDALVTPAAQTLVDSERIQWPGTAAAPSERVSLRRRQRQWTMLAGVAVVAALVAALGFWRLWQQDYF
jgi:serine/threonine protein kinase